MRLLTRKKGEGTYYYLQHSLKKDGKTITKEKYLGTEIPVNLEEIKKKFITELRHDTYRLLEQIKTRFQSTWKRTPLSARARELQEIAIAFTYNTNAIEGSTITLPETREIIQNDVAPHKPLLDIRETQAHAQVFLSMLKKKEELTANVFLRWHRTIFRETKPDIAGTFRDYSVSVGSYRAVDWQDIELLIEKLLDVIKKNQKTMNPVELAGRAHYIFEKIHPFGDGNGRIGRLLIGQILWHARYPMLIIERSRRTAYYKALQRDEEGFVNYFIRRFLAVHKPWLTHKEN